MKLIVKLIAAASLVACAGAAFAQAGETVKLVRIDPLTGLLGPVGVSQFKGYQFFAEKFSGKGNPAGVNFEITAIDNVQVAVWRHRNVPRKIQLAITGATPADIEKHFTGHTIKNPNVMPVRTDTAGVDSVNVVAAGTDCHVGQATEHV